MTTIKIKPGTIKCKFCNKDYPDALSAYNCGCGKRRKWNNPYKDRGLGKKQGWPLNKKRKVS